MNSKPEKPSRGWSSIRSQLNNWSKPAVIALVKALCRDSLREQVQMLETTLGKAEETAPPHAPRVPSPAT